jgi:hypothetical protein
MLHTQHIHGKTAKMDAAECIGLVMARECKLLVKPVTAN